MVETDQALITEAKTAPAPSPHPALADIVQSQLQTLHAYHCAVMESDDVEAIHKTRVTTRRLQASLDLLEWKDGTLNVRALKKRLRRWRRMLSRVRNYDVFLLFVEKEVGTGRRAHRQRYELLKSILQKRRARMADKVRRHQQQFNVSQLGDRLGIKLSLQSQEQAGGEIEPESGGQEQAAASEGTPGGIRGVDEKKVLRRAAGRLEQRLREFQALAAQSHPSTNPADLHQLRIAAKRLRYLLELVSEMGYDGSERALVWLRNLQDRIGDWHDLEALEAEIVGIVAHPKFIKKNLDESSSMLHAAAHLQKKKEALAKRLFPINVPKTVVSTALRITRDLRKESGSPPRPLKRKRPPQPKQEESPA